MNIADSLVKATKGHITITGQFRQGANSTTAFPERRHRSAVTETYGMPRCWSAIWSDRPSILTGFLLSSFYGDDTEKGPHLQDQAVFGNPSTDGSWAGFVLQDPNGVILPQETANYFGIKLGIRWFFRPEPLGPNTGF